jgi:hypothetical protein
VYAQLPNSNLRLKKIAINFPTQQIDSFSIAPNTFSLFGIDKSLYKLNEVDATIIWLQKPLQDSLTVMYRVFPYKLNEYSRRFDYDKIKDYFKRETPFTVVNKSKYDKPFLNFGTIKSVGSFGRSVSFGNSQDAVLNSSLNLQLSGFIADSIEISAAITDNNIPIQPDGNTQDLRDFDRIFFQAKKQNWQVSLGDLDIRQNQQYFLNFYKRVQGVSASFDNKIGKHIKNSLSATGAVAKGKFARNILVTIEGNQGPYRLVGNNNELFFVILANTERVFIDGVKMQRGEDADYVINYNTAELTFTPKHLITKDLRIQVEFEYTDRNFLNAQLVVQDQIFVKDKLQIVLGAFSNADAKNSSIDQILEPPAKQFLSEIGDSISKAFYSSAVVDTFAIGKILYKKIDTLIGSTTYPNVYVLASNNGTQLFSLSFTYLGPGKGNYVQLLNASNGRSFKWVEPANGLPQGDWEPVTLLITPKKLQVFAASGIYQIKPNVQVKTEMGLSNYDVNLFSRLNKADDIGMANKTEINFTDNKIKLFKSDFILNSTLANEYVQAAFKPIERLRNVEFFRDWGLPFNTLPANENITSVLNKIAKNENNYFAYNVVNYNRNDGYNGIKQSIINLSTFKSLKVFTNFNYTNFKSKTNQGFFLRPTFDVNQTLNKLGNIETGYKYLGEFNEIRERITDSLDLLSFGFNVHELYVRSNQANANRWGISYIRRNDLLPKQANLKVANESDNLSLSTALTSSPKQKLFFTGTYRALKVKDPSLSSQKADKSILGRVEYLTNVFNGFVDATMLYEVGSGQEQKRDFVYVEVQQGQGIFNWIDYNNNGQQELNEFEEAIFPDQRRFIRLFTPSNQYVKANYLQFNYTIDLDPKNLLNKTTHNKGLKKLLWRSNTNSALQINKKQIAQKDFLFNPFNKTLVDTSLIALNSFFSNTYFYNRTNAKFGLEFTHSKSSNKTILSYGFESRDLRTILVKIRKSVKRNLVANFTVKQIKNVLSNEAVKFENRNFNVLQNIVEPTLTYNYKSNFRLTMGYLFANKKNRIDSLEQATSNNFNVDAKYNLISGSSISARLGANNIKFIGSLNSRNSSVGYLLLDGLQPGQNYLWNVDFTKRIGKNIELSIQYDGRKPAIGNTIHLGRASVRAIF